MNYWLYLSIFGVLLHWATTPMISVVMSRCYDSERKAKEKTGQVIVFTFVILIAGFVVQFVSSHWTGSFSEGHVWGYQLGWSAYVATIIQILLGKRVREAEKVREEEKETDREMIKEKWEEKWERMQDRLNSLEREQKRMDRDLRTNGMLVRR